MRVVNCNIFINTGPEKIISAFTYAEKLKDWWGVERCLVECKTGGAYTLGWGISNDGIKYISTGVIKKIETDRCLHIGNMVYLNPEHPFIGPQDLKIDIERKGEGCQLKLEQGPYPENNEEHWDWYYRAVLEAWPQVLITLKNYLEK